MIAQLKKITTFNAIGPVSNANPAAKTPSRCYVMAGIKNGKYVREQPKGSGFSCDSTYFEAPAGAAASS